MIPVIFRRFFLSTTVSLSGDPVYPVYVDSNVMAGRTGVYDANTQMWSNVIYMPCTAENNFVPEFPKENRYHLPVSAKQSDRNHPDQGSVAGMG